MAGNLLLENVSKKELNKIINTFPGTTPGVLQHRAGDPLPNGGPGVYAGWTAITRTFLTNAINGNGANPFNRELLPPHFYITFPNIHPFSAAQDDCFKRAGWISRLKHPNMGLKSIPAAQQTWPNVELSLIHISEPTRPY